MKFVFDIGERKWDPATHTYIDGTGEAGWLVDNTAGGEEAEYYLTHGNNAVTVTNHSNGAIDVGFRYDMLTGAAVGASSSDATAFNTDRVVADAVVGGFYGSEDDAKDGAKPTADPDYKRDFRISLPTAVGRSVGNTELSGSVYFAFSGTPDKGRIEVLPDFKKVGTITLTLSWNYNETLNTPGTDLP